MHKRLSRAEESERYDTDTIIHSDPKLYQERHGLDSAEEPMPHEALVAFLIECNRSRVCLIEESHEESQEAEESSACHRANGERRDHNRQKLRMAIDYADDIILDKDPYLYALSQLGWE